MAKTFSNDPKKIGGILILFAALEIVFFVLLAQHLYPNYSLSDNYISDLGVGSTAIIFNTAMQLFGLLLAAASYFLYKAGWKYSALAFLVTGIAGFCVGTFPETTGLPHVLSAMVTFDSVAVAAFGFSRVFKGYLSYYSLAAGLVGLLVTVLFVANLVTGSQMTFGLGRGGVEEVLFYDELIWAMVTGFCFATKRI